MEMSESIKCYGIVLRDCTYLGSTRNVIMDVFILLLSCPVLSCPVLDSRPPLGTTAVIDCDKESTMVLDSYHNTSLQ